MYKKGFTLAEVLIVIGVIGIVAAMTIPNLLSKLEEKRIVNQLLKVYAQLSQAHKLMQEEFEPIDSWNLENTYVKTDSETGKNIYNHSAQSLISERLRRYLKVARVCKIGEVCDERPSYTLAGVKLSDKWIVSGSGDSPADANFYLLDGTFVSLGWYHDGACDLSVILPGKKSILGRTRFFFLLSADGVEPEGLPTGKSTNKFEETCKAKGTSTKLGRGCAAWVIKNKNMDYLHCDLTWDGTKTSCY